MNRRTMLQVCAGVLATGFGVRAIAQVPGYKICAKEGHKMGSKTYSDWTFKVERVGVCPPEEGKDDKEDC